MDESSVLSESEEYSDEYSGDEDDSNVLQKSSRLSRQNAISTSREGKVSNPKRSNSDVAITDKLAENVKKERKLMRPSLNESKLIGSDGLIRIKTEFSSKLKYRHPSSKAVQNAKSRQQRLELEVDSAALYSSQLLSAYASFCQELMPSWNYRDTLRKIEDLGSKKIVRDYLQSMRNEVCKEHLEELHGKDKAERWYDELENGLRVHDIILNGIEVPPHPKEFSRENHRIETTEPLNSDQIEESSERKAAVDQGGEEERRAAVDQVEQQEMQSDCEIEFEEESRNY